MCEVGEVHARIQDENARERLIRADVALSGPVVFVRLDHEERGYPVLIENASDFSFSISQAVSTQVRSVPVAKLYTISSDIAAKLGSFTSGKAIPSSCTF